MTFVRTLSAAFAAILLALVLWIVITQTIGRSAIFPGEGAEPQRGPVLTTR
jgi:hypothetical protein